MADKAKFSFRAKTYRNRKDEARLQISGLQADFVKFSDGEKDAQEALRKALSEALKPEK